jgi:tetratricopeptide (TPR) repeat protein
MQEKELDKAEACGRADRGPDESDAAANSDDDDDLSQVGPESTSSGEEFLFHLYRGSELLQDNCISEAKEELERALSMQPRDVEGQGLLGIVYFRLGLYPRAIKIYEEIVRACPGELTPRVNLALCYIKTGQLSSARSELETVISKAPERTRAWGYLGLVFERTGDLHKARAAFEKAQQGHLAQRMDRMIRDEQGRDSDLPERIEVRQAAADAVFELETAEGATGAFSGASVESSAPRSGHWRAIEPGTEAIPPATRAPKGGLARDPSRPLKSLPPLSLSPPKSEALQVTKTAAELAAELLIEQPIEGNITLADKDCLLLRISEGFCIRQDTMGAMMPSFGEPFKSSVVMRRQRGKDSSEPMGGHVTPFVLLEGQGEVLLQGGRPLEVLRVKGSFVYLREASLVGFEATVRYEHGRLSALGDEAVPMVQLSGTGTTIFERRGRLRALSVSAERPLTVLARLVVGWTGRLLSEPVEAKHAPNQAHGFVLFNGDGAVFLEFPEK